MYKLVVDLEMNDGVHIKYGNGYTNIREIIEIGAVLLDDNNEICSEKRIYVKPKFSDVSEYITELTGVTQLNVENAQTFEEALVELENMIIDRDNTVLHTWSESDCIAIRKEIKVKRIDNDYIEHLINNYVDVQKLFDRTIGFEKQTSLERTLEILDINTSGNAHDALVDAKNTAIIYKNMMDDNKTKEIIERVSDIFTDKPISTSLGSLLANIKLS